jgi:hypothetical protein
MSGPRARLLALAASALPVAAGPLVTGERAQAPDALTAPATSDALDRERAAWRCRRTVELPDDGRPLAELELPPELWTQAQDDLRDLRLIDPEGRERPYVIDRQQEREGDAGSWAGTLIDTRRERKLRSEWIVDLGQARAFDQVTLDVPGSGFAKRLSVEASDDARAWRLLRADAGIFERDWNGPLRHTRVELDAPASARYLRLAADDRASAPIDVTGVSVQDRRRRSEARWSRPAALRPESSPRGTTVLRVDVPPGLPVEALALDAADAAFSRPVRLVERDARGERRVLGEARLHRVRFDRERLVSEGLLLETRAAGRGALLLEIDDGDSPPLRAASAVVSGTQRRLLFAAAPGRWTLYYGNGATRAPLYDLSALAASLAFAPQPAPARLGDENLNPHHAAAPPLAFAATAGAALEASRWRVQRRLKLERDDVYALTLEAHDLGRLRDDLGDLRLADSQGRQVPYILEPGADEKRVPLRLTHEPASGRASGSRLTSAYRLEPEAPAGLPGAAGLAPVAPPARQPPLTRLELMVTQAFFARPARVVAPAEGRANERTLWQGALSRVAGSPADRPLALPLDGRRHAALRLEIDEGDNAPLTLSAAHAVVRVPRLTFKAAPGEYRLLLHNDDAEPPRYDLDLLRREVLAYSALPASPAAAEDNPAYRRRARDYVAGAPPTLLLWGTLAAAVLGLIGLTARVLRKAEGT